MARPPAAAPVHEKMLYAEEMMNRHLANANEHFESGQFDKAEVLYDKSQYWLDRYNALAGNN